MTGITLNPEQQQAVTHSGSPLLVIAGPGSGKTRVIIERVMHLIKLGIKSSEILCLTFSEKAAEEMRQRLEKLTDITEMEISTFHSFAKEVLEDNVLDSGIGMSSGVIKRSSQLVWGLKHIDDFKLEYLEIGNNSVEIIESIIDGISTFKDELISPEELQKYIRTKLEKNISDEERSFLLKLSDLCKVYFKYQEFQRSKAVIDFDDMVIQTIGLFKKKPNVLSKYQKKFKHVLVDEFQDNNFAQLELVKLIAKEGNVTVVGDDDQSIYRFQGAYLTNFKDFQSHFPKTTIIVLNRNYRSPQNIVSLASQLLEGLPERQQKKLRSEYEEGDKITVAQCANESAEVEFVVKTIKELVGKKIKRRDGTDNPLTYRDFVILSRRKSEGKKFAKSLKAHGIPTNFIGESNIFSSPVIRDMMAFLRIANKPTTAGIEIFRLMKNHGISEMNIARINYAAMKKARNDPTDIDFVFETLKNCDSLDITQKDEANEIAQQIQKIIDLESKSTISEMVYQIMISVSDLYKRLIQSDTPENRRNQLVLKEFYNISIEYESLNPQGELDDFIKYLSLMGQFDIELKEGVGVDDSIPVTTIHQSKGQEFPVVFIVDVATNKLPLRYQAKKFYVPNELSKGVIRTEDEKELYVQEERRLLYVAMTRAQNLLYITYARRYGQNVRETKPSKFLEDVKFDKNPLINVIEYQGQNGEALLEEEKKIERIKQDLQTKAVRSLNQMHLKSAIQRIVELAKVKHFEENGTIQNFKPEDILKIDNNDANLDAELQGKKVPIISKDELRLSASKIKTYLDCPLKFKFAHILQVPTPPKPYFDLGSAVHAVAEHLTKLQLEGTPSTEELAFEILAREWNSNGFQNETQENQSKEKAKEMIKTYLKWVKENPNSPVAVEQRFTVEIGGVPFNGFIDRVEKTSDGKFEVIDFKTGGVYENSNSIREDPQMNIYALGVEKMYGEQPQKTSLFYLKHDKIIENPIERQQVEKVRQSIDEKVKSILNEEFEATPRYQTCRMCDFWSICDQKEVDE
ncbi:MAG: ATP-dependent helicase [Candidatus Nitrosotenuis sp.]|nr:MAG: ATP-dependent helicase [Candidatus Nitrosotenuis sp.]